MSTILQIFFFFSPVVYIGMGIATACFHDRISAGLFWPITLYMDFKGFLNGKPKL